jgi:hypothetical protein
LGRINSDYIQISDTTFNGNALGSTPNNVIPAANIAVVTDTTAWGTGNISITGGALAGAGGLVVLVGSNTPGSTLQVDVLSAAGQTHWLTESLVFVANGVGGVNVGSVHIVGAPLTASNFYTLA